MVRAYSRLRQVLDEQHLTIPELHRRIREQGLRVNLKSLYRLSKDQQPLQRLNLSVAGAICQVFAIPLTELITFEKPRSRLRRLAPSKQKRLELLMALNNDGKLTTAERQELRDLVQEAESITLANARTLASQRQGLATP